MLPSIIATENNTKKQIKKVTSINNKNQEKKNIKGGNCLQRIEEMDLAMEISDLLPNIVS